MFKNHYQYGKHVQLLNVQDKDSIKNWAVASGNLKKAYDKTVKGYVLVFDGQTKLQMPKESRKQELYLLQTNILLQIKVLDKKSFNLEIVLTDSDKNKRRLTLYGSGNYSYSKDNIARSPLATRIPSSMILEGVWLNLQIDVQSFYEKCYNDAFKFRSIDAISLQGACLLRKIVSCKQLIPDSFQFVIEREFGAQEARAYEDYVAQVRAQNSASIQQIEPIESKLDFAPGVDHMNQVISFDRLTYFGYIFEESGKLAEMSSPGQQQIAKPAVAFGVRALKHFESPSPAKIRIQGYQEMIALQAQEENPYMSGYLPAQEQLPQETNKFFTPQKLKPGLASSSLLPKVLAKMQTTNNAIVIGQSPYGAGTPNFHIVGSQSAQQLLPIKKGQIYVINNSDLLTAKDLPARPALDDNQLNAKIKLLRQQRDYISKMAEKYDLNDDRKVQQLTLLKIQKGTFEETPAQANDRIKEYHKQTAERRKVIHAKTEVKRKLRAEEEAKLLEEAMQANPKAAETASQQLDQIRKKKGGDLKKKDLSKRSRDIVKEEDEDMNEGGTGSVEKSEYSDEEDKGNKSSSSSSSSDEKKQENEEGQEDEEGKLDGEKEEGDYGEEKDEQPDDEEEGDKEDEEDDS